MNGVRRWTLTGIVLAATLQASAVWSQEPGQTLPAPGTPAAQPASPPENCPGPVGPGPDAERCYKHPIYYSLFRYWAPGAARAYDYAFGPKLPVYAPDRYPDIPPDYITLKYRCQYVDPAATIIQPPLPPETSKARYILGPR